MVTFTKKLLLVLIGLYSLLLPAFAQEVKDITFGQYLLSLPFPWDTIMIALPYLFLLLLLFALFMIPLTLLKDRFGLTDNKIPGVLAVVLAMIGTYYGSTNQLLWSFWLSLFTGGIFLVAIIILIGALLILVGAVAKAGGYTAEGMGTLAQRRGEWFEKAKGKEIQRAAWMEKKAAAMEKGEEYGLGQAQRILRGVRNWGRRRRGKAPIIPPAQRKKDYEIVIEHLREAEAFVRQAFRREGVSEKETLVAFRVTGEAKKETIGAEKIFAAIRKRTAGKLEKTEEGRLNELWNLLRNLVKQSNQVRAMFNRITKEIKQAEKLYKKAADVKGRAVVPILDEIDHLLESADILILDTERLLERRRRMNAEVAQLLQQTIRFERRVEKTKYGGRPLPGYGM